jgi:hypothetical protein
MESWPIIDESSCMRHLGFSEAPAGEVRILFFLWETGLTGASV